MNPPAQTLICPKCGSEMRSYERNGVTLEQCTGCRGIFLDRGELEHLVDAESAHYEREGRGSEPERRDEREHYDDRDRRDDRGRKPKKSKKRSFLENLMESMGE